MNQYHIRPAPSDFFLFPNLKRDIRGCRRSRDGSGKDPDFFSSGSIPIYPLQRVFYPQTLACAPKNDEVPYVAIH